MSGKRLRVPVRLRTLHTTAAHSVAHSVANSTPADHKSKGGVKSGLVKGILPRGQRRCESDLATRIITLTRQRKKVAAASSTSKPAAPKHVTPKPAVPKPAALRVTSSAVTPSVVTPPTTDPTAPARRVEFVSQWYRSSSQARNAEIDACAKYNLGNRAFDRLVWYVPPEDMRAAQWLVLDADHSKASVQAAEPTGSAPLPSPRVELRALGARCPRLTFGLAFSHMDRSDTVYVLANSDICVPEESVPPMVRWVGEATLRTSLCLTRWEAGIDERGNVTRATGMRKRTSACQDCWVVRGGGCLNRSVAEVTKQIALGIPGCDNRVAYELNRVGRTANPSKSIKTLHVHRSAHRTYTQHTTKIPKPYHHIAAHS